MVADDRETVHQRRLLDNELAVMITSSLLLKHPTYGYALEVGGFTAWHKNELIPLPS